MGAARRGQAVDDAIDLAEVGVDRGDDLRLDGVGKRVAIERAGIQPGGGGLLFEGGGVVPTGRADAFGVAGFLEKHADGRGPRAEGGGDARGQAVAGGGPDDEHLLRAVGDGAAVFDDRDLFGDVPGAAVGMGGGADESADLGGNDHEAGNISTIDGGANPILARLARQAR